MAVRMPQPVSVRRPQPNLGELLEKPGVRYVGVRIRVSDFEWSNDDGDNTWLGHLSSYVFTVNQHGTDRRVLAVFCHGVVKTEDEAAFVVFELPCKVDDTETPNVTVRLADDLDKKATVEIDNVYMENLRIRPEMADDDVRTAYEEHVDEFVSIFDDAFNIFAPGAFERAASALSLGRTTDSRKIPALITCWQRAETSLMRISISLPRIISDEGLIRPLSFVILYRPTVTDNALRHVDYKNKDKHIAEVLLLEGLANGIETYLDAVVAGVPLSDLFPEK